MIISIKKKDGTIDYDITKIEDASKRGESQVIINKVGNLSVVIEALTFASDTHRANLEKLLEGCPESQVVGEDDSSTEKSEKSE